MLPWTALSQAVNNSNDYVDTWIVRILGQVFLTEQKRGQTFCDTSLLCRWNSASWATVYTPKNYSNNTNFYISWGEKEFRHLFFPTFGCVISYKKLCEPIVPEAAAEAFWQGKPTKFLIRCYTFTFFLFGHDCKIVFPRNNACWICSLPGLEIRSFNLLIFDLSIFPIFKNDRRERIDLFHDRIDLSITKKWSIWSKTNDQIPNPALYTTSTLFLSFHNWLTY